MSEPKWAAIVYGRSYYLDFRLIAVPKDFSNRKIDWALEHIIATTRTADKLSAHPRWSLFKDKSHCIIGVTCMVRDLLGNLTNQAGQGLTQDNCGRPLYVFVGYSTKLENQSKSTNYFPYMGNNLKIFQPLYDYVQQQWQVKKYDRDHNQPIVTNYSNLIIENQLNNCATNDKNLSINHQYRVPNQIFLWQDVEVWRQKLWDKAVDCQLPLSLCLGATKQKDLITSPFINGTVEDIHEFTIQEKINLGNQFKSSSLSQKITQKIKTDLQITRQNAEKAAIVGQEIINNLGTKVNQQSISNPAESQNKQSSNKNFGFKPKNSNPERDWF
ncbi:MAG: hypothetical protein Kow0049_27860 [Stanieria sp.]